MIDLKIVAAVIIVLAVVGAGFFANFGLRSFFRPIEEKFSDFFGLGDENMLRNVSFSLRVDNYPNISNDDTRNTNLTIETAKDYELKTSIGNFKTTEKSDKIEIAGFRGSVRIIQNNITLNGDFSSLKTNKMNITSGSIDSGFIFDSLITKNMNVHELKLTKGILMVNGIYNLSERNSAEIDSIKGDFTFNKDFTGSGLANKIIIISGNVKIAISS